MEKEKRGVWYWLLVVYIIFMIIQIMRKIFGGSWGVEELITGLVIGNITYTMALHKTIMKMNSEVLSKIALMDSKLSEHMGWHKGKDNHSKTL